MHKTATVMRRIVLPCAILCLAAVSGCTRTVTVVGTASPSLETTATTSSQSPAEPSRTASAASPLAALRWAVRPVIPGNLFVDANDGVEAAACPSAGSCIVAGQVGDGGFATTISGNAWEPEMIASSGNYQGIGLSAASCPQSGRCVVAGQYQDTESDHWLGVAFTAGSPGSWEMSRIPLPDDAGSASNIDIDSLDCPAAGECAAVGDFWTGTEQETAMVATLSSGAWTAAEVPLPPDAVGAGGVDQGVLFAVSCSAPGSCVAVGRYHRADGLYRGLIETLRNGTWSAAEAPAVSDADQAGLRGVDCSAAGSCTAVGESSSGAVIETLASGTWRVALAPLPAGVPAGSGASLYAVACPTPGACVAVGAYFTNDASGNSTDHPIIVTLSNGHWSSAAAPLPSDATTTSGNGVSLDRVACTKTGDCVAVGDYSTATGFEKPFIETAVP